MNFSQLHERLRLYLASRIQRGLLTGTQLAAQAGVKPPHISNFLRRHRRLSLDALDRILEAQAITAADLMPSREAPALRQASVFHHVPLVRDDIALRSPLITRAMTLEVLDIPATLLDGIQWRRTASRADWQRFVAVRVTAQQALPLAPVLTPDCIAVLDRHYNSLKPYRPPEPSLYAVRIDHVLAFRYLNADSRRIVLRPASLAHPVEIFDREEAAAHLLIAGRVCLCISQL